jgi:hypothetical protein
MRRSSSVPKHKKYPDQSPEPIRVAVREVEPLVVTQDDGARMLGRSPAWMRAARANDRDRVARGLPPLGPVWFVQNGHYYYRVADLKAWLDRTLVALGRAEFKAKPAEAE